MHDEALVEYGAGEPEQGGEAGSKASSSEEGRFRILAGRIKDTASWV